MADTQREKCPVPCHITVLRVNGKTLGFAKAIRAATALQPNRPERRYNSVVLARTGIGGRIAEWDFQLLGVGGHPWCCESSFGLAFSVGFGEFLRLFWVSDSWGPVDARLRLGIRITISVGPVITITKMTMMTTTATTMMTAAESTTVMTIFIMQRPDGPFLQTTGIKPQFRPDQAGQVRWRVFDLLRFAIMLRAKKN